MVLVSKYSKRLLRFSGHPRDIPGSWLWFHVHLCIIFLKSRDLLHAMRQIFNTEVTFFFGGHSLEQRVTIRFHYQNIEKQVVPKVVISRSGKRKCHVTFVRRYTPNLTAFDWDGSAAFNGFLIKAKKDSRRPKCNICLYLLMRRRPTWRRV